MLCLRKEGRPVLLLRVDNGHSGADGVDYSCFSQRFEEGPGVLHGPLLDEGGCGTPCLLKVEKASSCRLLGKLTRFPMGEFTSLIAAGL